MSATHEIVQEYYGRRLTATADLKSTACCDASQAPAWLKALLEGIHPEVLSRYYGCGLVCPPLLAGCRVLDLGCGSGRDAYALAQLVGPEGDVVGVDMTEEQLEVAERHRAYHAERFGYGNVRFLRGFIEQLDELDLAPASFDVIVSNCVVNLSPDKPAVLAQVARLLKPGGEFYFADVYADRRVPTAVREDPVLYGECLGGALYWNDFLRLARAAGFTDPRLVEDRPISVGDPRLAARVEPIRFFPPRGGCSGWKGSRTPARITAKPCSIAAPSRPARRASTSTSIITSRRAACFPSAATPSACSARAACGHISIFWAISAATTVCSAAAAGNCRSIPQGRRWREAAAVEERRGYPRAADSSIHLGASFRPTALSPLPRNRARPALAAYSRLSAA